MGTEVYRIPLEEIESSNLAAIGYDPQRQILAVQFKATGDIYHYGSVTVEIAADFGAAPSKGSFFALEIKGKYPGQKMTGTCPACGDKAGYIGTPCTDCGAADYADVPKEPK